MAYAAFQFLLSFIDMPAKHPEGDRNFNDLSHRFKRNIYDTPKGQIRLAVLKRDFQTLPLALGSRVLDVGAGQGQFALWLAAQGHSVLLTDVAEDMLAQAQMRANGQIFEFPPSFELADLWSLPDQADFAVVTCHAVLEWLEEPLMAIDVLWSKVAAGGYLSLLFYNVHGLVFKNLLRANYKKVVQGDVRGQRGSLTPISPLDPVDVLAKLVSLGAELCCHSGVRVFHDYILDLNAGQQAPDTVMALELELSTVDPYRGLGRYVHVVVKKKVLGEI